MQTIKKVLNSSVVLVVDERGAERVLLGKGIGFGAKAGEVIEASAVDQVFVALDDADQRNLVELLAQIPPEFVELTRAVVADAEEQGLKLDPHVYLALTDHLHFAVERQRRGLAVANRLAWEMRSVYPVQYAVGERAVAAMRCGWASMCRTTRRRTWPSTSPTRSWARSASTRCGSCSSSAR